MLIVGGYDYYDSIGQYDDDKTRVFKRNEKKTLPYDALPSIGTFTPVVGEDDIFNQWKTRHLNYRHIELIIFCGVQYRGIQISSPQGLIHWTAKSFIKEAEALYKIEIDPDFVGNRWRSGCSLNNFFTPYKIKDQSKLIENNVLIARVINSYLEYKKSWKWELNPVGLKNLNFAQIVPPAIAYQELEMYLGTILVNDQDHMVKVSDKTKLLKYGFDKTSFKNMVHPSKPRGRKNG